MISRHSNTNLPALTMGIILSSMALCLLYYVCELGVEFLYAFACCLRVWGFQGLFQGGPQYAPQVLEGRSFGRSRCCASCRRT